MSRWLSILPALPLLVISGCEPRHTKDWCDGNVLVKVYAADGTFSETEEHPCGSRVCVDGDFGAECVMADATKCVPETQECVGDIRVVCGRSGLTTFHVDCAAQGLACFISPHGTECAWADEVCETAYAIFEWCRDNRVVTCGWSGHPVPSGNWRKPCESYSPGMTCADADGWARCFVVAAEIPCRTDRKTYCHPDREHALLTCLDDVSLVQWECDENEYCYESWACDPKGEQCVENGTPCLTLDRLP
jgi:hypothetical protein